MSTKEGLKIFYNNRIVEQPEKNDSSSNNNNKSQDFLGEIVKELCNLYNEERSKGKISKSILDLLEKFIEKKNQNPDNIINWCLNDKINPTVQIILGHFGFWYEEILSSDDENEIKKQFLEADKIFKSLQILNVKIPDEIDSGLHISDNEILNSNTYRYINLIYPVPDFN
ncbi:9134_t:CDS:2 [Scutellospora calospora]|uniref:9134_t:CDS:1 n=1 Tax=Scutellospora calospora TaxID=85575 RepID=A0ACA9KEE5_9GLOM|nr:9134_t:CDS:2 [Scutellospora calospora]